MTLAFAGDIHFEGAVASLLDDPASDLGPMSDVLRSADVAVVNLESAVTTGGSPAAKELEDADNRYWFRTPPAALSFLERSGADVATMADEERVARGCSGVHPLAAGYHRRAGGHACPALSDVHNRQDRMWTPGLVRMWRPLLAS